MKKLRILQVASAFEPLQGGTERVVGELAREIALLGHSVTVLTTNLFAPQARLGEEKIVFSKGGKKAEVRVVRVPNKLLLAGYGFAPGVVGWLKRHWREFDVAHCHGYNRHATESALFFLQGRLPTAFTAHGFYHTSKNRLLKQVHEKVLGSRACRAASACVAITQDDVKVFEGFGVPKERISIIPNGVALEKFSQKLAGKNEFAKFKPFVLFVGRLHASKGLQFLAEAVKELPCRLVIIGGDSGFEKSLREIVSAFGIEQKVVFVGEASEEKLVAAYQACEMFVLPSEWEAFGVVLVEAMAAGKPVIGSDRGAIPRLVKDGKNGFVVPFADVSKLKEKIALLLKDKKLASKMGQRGKEFAKQFSWQTVARDTEKLYLKLAAKTSFKENFN